MRKLLLFVLFPLLITSCSKNDPDPDTIIDSPTLELNYDKEHQFTLKKGSDDVFASTFTWTSSDEKVGKVDANGLFKARKIGKTTITGISKDGKHVESQIEIKPYNNVVSEPVIEFGATETTVRSKETRKFIGKSGNSIFFEGDKTVVQTVGYSFENGRLDASILVFVSSSAVVTATTTYYKERYPDKGVVENSLGFLDDPRTFVLFLSVSSGIGYNGLYMPYTKGGRVNADNTKAAIIQDLVLFSSSNRP